MKCGSNVWYLAGAVFDVLEDCPEPVIGVDAIDAKCAVETAKIGLHLDVLGSSVQCGWKSVTFWPVNLASRSPLPLCHRHPMCYVASQ
jgi:hypothetical protein